MAKKRPCRICRKWFEVDVRAGGRQRVCSTEECQRERHRQACAAWHERHPDYDKAERLRRKVVPEVAVLVEEPQKVLVDWARDAVLAQQSVIARESRKVGGVSARDALGARSPPT